MYQIDPPPIVECYIAGQWKKREENDINIGKPFIHKAAVSGINETFPSFSRTDSLIIFHQPGLAK